MDLPNGPSTKATKGKRPVNVVMIRKDYKSLNGATVNYNNGSNNASILVHGVHEAHVLGSWDDL